MARDGHLLSYPLHTLRTRFARARPIDSASFAEILACIGVAGESGDLSHLVLIGGLTGSGKSTVGKYLARRMRYAYIDKDTVTRDLVDALVIACGSEVGLGDRDSSIYLKHARPPEYQCFMNTVYENIDLGIPTIATAPFISEMPDADWIQDVTEEAESYGAKLSLIWIECAVDTTRMRLGQRNAVRDQIKMVIWDDYAKFADTISPPPSPVRSYSNSQHQSIASLCDAIIEDIGHLAGTHPTA